MYLIFFLIYIYIFQIFDNCVTGCLKCDKNGNCLICDIINLKVNDGNGGCISLPEVRNCKYYSHLNYCIECKEGYNLSFNGEYFCKKYPIKNEYGYIENCLKYNDYGCGFCKKDYYLKENKCIKVVNKINSCNYYNPKEQCLECQIGFILENNICKQLYDKNLKTNFCLKFNGLYNCKNCLKEINENNKKIYIKKVKNSVYESLKNYNYIEINKLILNINNNSTEIFPISNCIKSDIQGCKFFNKNNSLKCDECLEGYFLTENKKECIKNPESQIIGCAVYENLTTCIDCEYENYYKDNNNNCIERFKGKINQIDNCDELNKNEDRCKNCKFYYVLNSLGQCIEKIETKILNCIKWDSVGIACSGCDKNYILINNKCEKEIEGCLKHNIDGKSCKECDPKKLYIKVTNNEISNCKKLNIINCYEINPTNGNCIKCKNNTILNQENLCVSYFINCVYADNKCLKCPQNYHIINYKTCNTEGDNDCIWFNGENCIRCKNNKKPLNNTCITSTPISNCELYDAAGLCVQCITGYGKPLNDGTCSNNLVSSGCSEYKILGNDNTNLTCTKCFNPDLSPSKSLNVWICRKSLEIQNCDDNAELKKNLDICINCKKGFLKLYFNNYRICFNENYNIENPPSDHCLIKKSDGICFQCQHGYLFNGTICELIQGCDISDNNNFYYKYCRVCLSNFILSQDKKKCITFNKTYNINSCSKYALTQNDNIYCYECSFSSSEKYLIKDNSLNINEIIDFFEYDTNGDLNFIHNGSNYVYGECTSILINPQYSGTVITNLIGSHIFELNSSNHILIACFKGYYYDPSENKCTKFLASNSINKLHFKYSQLLDNNFLKCNSLIQKPSLINNNLITCNNYSIWNINLREKCFILNSNSCYMCNNYYKNNSTGCEVFSNLNFCENTNTPNFCEKCSSNKVLNSNMDNCIDPPSNIENCLKLNKNNDSCEICELNFTKKLLSNNKITCIKSFANNCKLFNNDNICLACNYNYSISDPKEYNYCLKDNKSDWCKSYDYINSKCLECLDNNKTLSYAQDNCNLEIPNCLIANNSNTKCSKCNTLKYYLDENFDCLEGNKNNCIEYYNDENKKNSCKTCKKGYFKYGFSQNNFSCYKIPLENDKYCLNIETTWNNGLNLKCNCLNNYNSINTLEHCSLRDINNCIEYKELSCIKCEKNFYLINQKCLPVIPILDCIEYQTNQNICKTCKLGFYFSIQLNKCIPNPKGLPNCLSYKNLNVCIKCDGESLLANENCIKVSENKKVDNCIKYNNEQNCSNCKEGYFLSIVNNYCISVNFNYQNCLTVNNLTECLTCKPKYYLDPTTKICNNLSNCIEYLINGNNIECRKCENYFYLENNICFSGQIPFCRIYVNKNECEICENNKILSDDKKSCIPIEDAFKIKYCDIYERSTICTLCEGGKVLNFEGKCIECNKNCLICDHNSPSICLICQNGFYMDKNRNCNKNIKIVKSINSNSKSKILN